MKILGDIRVTAALESLPLIAAFTREQAGNHGLLSEDRISNICMAVEEAVMNIIDHAYKGNSGEIDISCKSDTTGRLIITITDYAEAFNIFLATDPLMSDNGSSPAGKQPSMVMMKRFIKNIEYKRYENRNILVFAINPESR